MAASTTSYSIAAAADTTMTAAISPTGHRSDVIRATAYAAVSAIVSITITYWVTHDAAISAAVAAPTSMATTHWPIPRYHGPLHLR